MSELLQWILGQGGEINLPDQLDRYMRKNNSQGKPQELFVPPLMIPVFSLFTNWYDRNSEAFANAHVETGIAPHLITERLRYVVPLGKKAFVELLRAQVIRNFAAAVAGIPTSWWTYQPARGAMAINLLLARIFTNGVNDLDNQNLATAITLFEGDTLIGYSFDDSNGGACSFEVAYKLTEFDA